MHKPADGFGGETMGGTNGKPKLIMGAYAPGMYKTYFKK
jgi:hypothetical protein